MPRMRTLTGRSAAGATCFGTGMMTSDSAKLAVESMDQARPWLRMLPPSKRNGMLYLLKSAPERRRMHSMLRSMRARHLQLCNTFTCVCVCVHVQVHITA